jgi:predicted metalloendopeptidase
MMAAVNVVKTEKDPTCPCCRNPWSRPGDFEFAMACGKCTSDSSGASGLDPANMDLTASPSVDFYRHANGKWMDSNPIPGEYPSWNTFTALHDANLGRLKALLEGLKPPSGEPTPAEQQSVEDKVAAFWLSANDEGAIEQAGLVPLAPVLAACDLASTDKTAAVAKLQAEYGVNVLFALGEGPDDRDSSWTLHQLSQAGLGLPDRDYYFDEDKADKRELYLKHVAKTLVMLGESETDAELDAAAVLKLETALAAAHLTRTERRDPDTVYNKMSVGKLSALCKGALDWPRFFELAASKVPKALNVDNPVALAVASRLLEATPDAELRAYLRWHAARSCAAHLPAAFVDANFELYSKALSGQQEQKPRWKRAMAMVEGALGEAVGQLYVRKHFAPEAKARALDIVGKVRLALEARLHEVAWMQPSTRAKALEKYARTRPSDGARTDRAGDWEGGAASERATGGGACDVGAPSERADD